MSATAARWSSVSAMDRVPAAPVRAPIWPPMVRSTTAIAVGHARIADRHRGGLVTLPQAAPGDHAHLEREQLVEGESVERGVERRLVDREVDGLDGRADGHLVATDRVGRGSRDRARGVDGRSHRPPQGARADALRQPVDRQQAIPAGAVHRRLSELEVGVLERGPVPVVDADLARDQQPAARRADASLDELAPEPDRLDLVTVLVLEPGDRALQPSAADDGRSAATPAGAGR